MSAVFPSFGGLPGSDISLPGPAKKLSFASVYSKCALYDALLRVYTKPLFCWKKALSVSWDERTLYDFARHGAKNLERLDVALQKEKFHFREGIAVQYTFNRRRRVIYLFPWEERIVDQLLFQTLNRAFHWGLSSHNYGWRHHGFGIDPCQHRIARSLGTSHAPVYVIKRDIANYFPSVTHSILLGLLEQWIDKQDYLYTLVKERIKFSVRTVNGVETAQRGIPFGTPIACFLANLYITPLDYEIAAIPSLQYYRYADDILAFSCDRDAVLQGSRRLETVLEKLNLRGKPSHEMDLLLGESPAADLVFDKVLKFRHLGLEFRQDGSVGLPRDKGRKIRNLFRFAFRRARGKLKILQDPEQRAQLLIAIANAVIEQGFRSVAIIDYYLKHVDDEEQLRLIDRWLAEEVLAQAFHNGHRKRNFLHLSFGRLREMGLPSLRHRRRLLRHGHIKSSFFLMRTTWLIEKERRRRQRTPPENERGRLPGPRTFSPYLEAAADTSLVRKRAACR